VFLLFPGLATSVGGVTLTPKTLLSNKASLRIKDACGEEIVCRLGYLEPLVRRGRRASPQEDDFIVAVADMLCLDRTILSLGLAS
jgi:hypothetical protein